VEYELHFIKSSFGSMRESHRCRNVVSDNGCSFVDEGEHTSVFHAVKRTVTVEKKK
jgi:hypothetical protein